MEIDERIIEKYCSQQHDILPPFPTKNLLIEVTNCCNNKCIFCYNQYMQRQKAFIDENICVKALSEAYDLGCREVGFYVTGEPLLNNNLEKYIAEAKKIGYDYIYITTNGILATLDRVVGLYEAGLNSIKFSINAYDKEFYKKINGTDNYYKVVKNLNDVYTWKKQNNIDFNVFTSFITTRYTDDVSKIEKMFLKTCDKIIIQPAINQGGLLPETIDTISDGSTNKFLLPCSYPFESVIVTVEGYVTACCMDFENLLAYGNLNTDSLEEIWKNQTIQKLRKQHLDNDLCGTICDNCINNSKNIPIPIEKKLCFNKKIYIK